MTNREWLLNKMQNMSDEEISSNFNNVAIISRKKRCYDLKTKCHKDGCKKCITLWLKEEHKEPITLSEAERIILENIDKEYCYIARDRTGFLTVFLGKPRKGSDIWESRGFKHCYINCFNHLFQFITWENSEPYNIEELLKCGD
jgi:hypothetical protein